MILLPLPEAWKGLGQHVWRPAVKGSATAYSAEDDVVEAWGASWGLLPSTLV